MTRRARRELAIGALLVSAAACGGGGAGAPVSRSAPRATHPAATTADTTTTTAIASTTNTTTRVAGRPIVDRGSDVVEVARSLLLFGRWLEAEHPDPALVDLAFAWQGNLARSV